MSWSIASGLEGKGIVVTGAAGGIGEAIVAAFASAGAQVCAIDLRDQDLNRVVAQLPNTERHLAVSADLMDLASQERVLRQAMDTFGCFDVLAHAAAVLRRRHDIEDVTEDDWDFQLDVNLKATFFLNRAAARLFREQRRGGRIINLVSQAWWSGGFGGSVVYAASKGGIVSMSRGLARTLAPYNITVNTVAPGVVDTPMMRSGLTEEQLDDFRKMVPLGRRLSRPEEIAGAVVFLASDHASHITSTTMNVTGGMLTY
jgi:NAD(P)-dependent dehydrogenase (short-subunit alcohol dehydrogenase family)